MPGINAAFIRELLPGSVGDVRVSKTARLVCGNVRAGDIVMLKTRDVSEVSGFAMCLIDGEKQLIALLKPRRRLDGNSWSIDSAGDTVAWASDILAACIVCSGTAAVVVIDPPAIAAGIA